ncbi:DUF2612 domain-containing protein [Salmonella enterica subsp. enterica serovar Newport]
MNNYFEGLIPAYQLEQPRYSLTLEAVSKAFSGVQDSLKTIAGGFDLDKATGKQLDIIGLWIGRGRKIRTPIVDYFFTFDDPKLGFDYGNWKNHYDSAYGFTALDDKLYRTILRAKIGANNWNGTAEDFPGVLASIYPDGNIFISYADNNDDSITITVRGKVIPPIVREIIRQGYFDIKPQGIKVNYSIAEG